MLNRSHGFTFVELLVVIVVIGILAELAIPHLQPLTNRARLAALQSDIRNAEFAEESYFAEADAYATLPQLEAAGTLKISPGVTLAVTVTATGYTLSATNPAITTGPQACQVVFGSGGTTTPNSDGTITCE